MDLKSITFFAFHEHYERIGRQLQHADRARPLLDAARRELPLVDVLLNMMHQLDELSEESRRIEAFNRLMHDIHVLLALRSIERGVEQDQQVPPLSASAPPASEGTLRLRRFGMN